METLTNKVKKWTVEKERTKGGQSFSHTSASVSPPSETGAGLSAEQIRHPNRTDTKTRTQKITAVSTFTARDTWENNKQTNKHLP